MSCKPILFCLVLFCFACHQPTENADNNAVKNTEAIAQPDEKTHTQKARNTTVSEWRIVPGERIGKTRLGMSATEIEPLLGKPDLSDAAMGKAWLTWHGKRDEHNNKTELNIYTTYKDSNMAEKTVQQIRVTSAQFETESGLGVYHDFREIKNYFPELQPAARYKNDGREIEIFDDRKNGIAFEFVTAGGQTICTGVIVHRKNEPVTQTYIYLHSDRVVR